MSKNNTLAIIAPDKASGIMFEKTIQNEGIETALFQRYISPRVVVGDGGVSQITTEIDKVSIELADHIVEVIEKGYKLITIACNSLSLENVFINPTKNYLEINGVKFGKDYLLLTTLDAIKTYFSRTNKRPPMLLGTNVTVSEIDPDFFDTPHNTGKHELQELVQEIVWRVKAVHGSDVTTSPNYDGDLVDREIYDIKLKELYELLKGEEIDELVMGCTELPIAFKRMIEIVPESKQIKTIDPANIVAQEVKKIISP